jgi:hypothetical protein
MRAKIPMIRNSVTALPYLCKIGLEFPILNILQYESLGIHRGREATLPDIVIHDDTEPLVNQSDGNCHALLNDPQSAGAIRLPQRGDNEPFQPL